MLAPCPLFNVTAQSGCSIRIFPVFFNSGFNLWFISLKKKLYIVLGNFLAVCLENNIKKQCRKDIIVKEKYEINTQIALFPVNDKVPTSKYWILI